MKSIIITLVFIISSATFASTAELSTTFLTQRIANNGTVLHADPIQNSELFIPFSHGFYGDFWNSTPWNGRGSSLEVDYTAGWTGSAAGANVNIGISYFDFDKLIDAAGDVLNPYVSISKELRAAEKHTLTPSIKIETPILIDSWKVTGVFTHVGVTHTWKISEKTTATQNLRVLYDSGCYGFEKGFVGKYDVTLSVEIIKNLHANAGVSIVKPLTVSDRHRTVTPSIGVTMNF